MTPKDINKKEFDEATKLKLKIFGDSFNEWLPVFIHDQYTQKVFIFDFFAGSGTDKNGELGSPLILLDKAKGENRKYCSKANRKPIYFFFNEGLNSKSNELQQNVENFIKQCAIKNKCSKCVYNYKILNYPFQQLFKNGELKKIFLNKSYAKFVILDQYGFKEINEDVFKELVSYPKTDFIFFISSSFVKRFKNHPYTRKYIDTSKIPFEKFKPNEIHRAIAKYFRSLIPEEKEYYLHHFSIKKGANYYGLIFGTNHTFGMEKFLKVCWEYDKLSGEANYNIDNNYEKGTLFYDPTNTVKKENVKEEIKNKILTGEITDNITGLKYALKRGCEPKLFVEVVSNLLESNKIKIIGEFNKQSTRIHHIKNIYQIKIN